MLRDSLDQQRISESTSDEYYITLLAHPDTDAIGASGVALVEVSLRHKKGAFVFIGDLDLADLQLVTNRSRIKPQVSWTRLRWMTQECDEAHTECRQEVARCLPNGFRLIDIVRRRIVEKSDVPFIALSYVWGNGIDNSSLIATRAEISGMKADNGLPTSRMPQTIEDAIIVTRQLGERYLWVDRLCIVQDDPEDKLKQINAMAGVFSSAKLVLIAAHSKDVDFGIHGISIPRRETQFQAEVDDLRITNVVQESINDPLAIWIERGWTYQEAVLARRRLFFTNVRAYFECDHSICHEDEYNQSRISEREQRISSGLKIKEDRSHFDAFMRHLENYSRRKLTYQLDTYNAFAGISQSIYGVNSRFIYGLPEVDFDKAMQWIGSDCSSELSRLESEGVVCPTWSWSACKNHSIKEAIWFTSTYIGMNCGTFIIWYQRTASSTTPADRLEAVNLHPETEVDGGWSLFMAVACEHGLLDENSTPGQAWMTDSFSTIQEKFEARWPDYNAFRLGALQSADSTRWRDEVNSVLPKLRPGDLLTISQTCSLQLGEKRDNGQDLGDFGRLEILDGQGNVVGRLLSRTSSFPYEKNRLHEFIALSLACDHVTANIRKEARTKNYFDADGLSLDYLPIVIVMMIGRRGPYAYRKGLGEVYLKDWIKLNTGWKVIILE